MPCSPGGDDESRPGREDADGGIRKAHSILLGICLASKEVIEQTRGWATMARCRTKDEEAKERGRPDAKVFFGQTGPHPGAPRGWTGPPNLEHRYVSIHTHQPSSHQMAPVIEGHPPIGLVKVITYGCSLGAPRLKPSLFAPHPQPSRTRPRSLSLTRT